MKDGSTTLPSSFRLDNAVKSFTLVAVRADIVLWGGAAVSGVFPWPRSASAAAAGAAVRRWDMAAGRTTVGEEAASRTTGASWGGS